MSNLISDVVKYLVLSARTSLPGIPGCGQDQHPSSDKLVALAHGAGFPDSLAVPFGTPSSEEVAQPLENLSQLLAGMRYQGNHEVHRAPEFRLTYSLESTAPLDQIRHLFDVPLFSRKGIHGPRGTKRDFVMSQYRRFAELSSSAGGPLVLVDPFADVQNLDLPYLEIARAWSEAGLIVGLSLDFWLKKELGQEDPRNEWSQGKRDWQERLAEDIVPRQRAALAQAGVPVVLLTNFHEFGPYTDPEGDLNSLFWSQAGEFVAYHRAIDDLRVLKGMRGLLDEIGTTRDMRA